MRLFGEFAEGPRVAVSGALRLARVLPILRVIRSPSVRELESVVNSSGRNGSLAPDVLVSLRQRRAELVGSTDVLLPDYYEATAVAMGLWIADPGGLAAAAAFSKTNAVAANLWECCDDIVHRAHAFASPPLSGLRTTLRGVENMWFERDLELLSSPVDPQEVLTARLRDIAGKMAGRRDIAETIARCAGWTR
ncbi:hypothetical protein ABT147_21285 [Streptomyces sp. NPDC001868]|uniref:hypothetical protein n=1 Tax=Streptomyces sp. NPDC001868 TaxID=3154401 RepID=UPI00333247E9